ncbi:MAG: AAA family ATPase [Candidatus Curtissbacteria bacterium]|nr:AAA family ATPase [Candidatus Curtissbacteria bacterium]
MPSSTAQFEDITLLENKLKSASLPPDLKAKALAQLERLVRLASAQGYSQEYDSISRYIDWIITLPWGKRSVDTLSIENARKIMDANHFGLEKVKERILEYIAVACLAGRQASLAESRRASLKESNSSEKSKAPTFLLLGLVGTGKTTLGYSIAQALGRQFGRIPMGGMGDALQLRGRSRAYPDAEPGQIMKVLRRVQTKNPVILLDEIDRVTDEAKADIMGVLVELLDPEQNASFLDHFVDYPFDLSEVLFIATANNTGGIATAVLDRLEVIEMPSYTDDQKIKIGKDYLLLKALSANGLSAGDIVFPENIWHLIVRPLGFDAGMRTLDRTISGICRKVAKLKVEGKATKITLTEENLKEYIPS